MVRRPFRLMASRCNTIQEHQRPSAFWRAPVGSANQMPTSMAWLKCRTLQAKPWFLVFQRPIAHSTIARAAAARLLHWPLSAVPSRRMTPIRAVWKILPQGPRAQARAFRSYPRRTWRTLTCSTWFFVMCHVREAALGGVRQKPNGVSCPMIWQRFNAHKARSSTGHKIWSPEMVT